MRISYLLDDLFVATNRLNEAIMFNYDPKSDIEWIFKTISSLREALLDNKTTADLQLLQAIK